MQTTILENQIRPALHQTTKPILSQGQRWLPWLGMMLAAALTTSLYVHQSLAAGRLACGIPLYDDVGYFEDALRRVQVFYQAGPREVFYEHWRHPLHAPWSTYAALAGYLLFGYNLWAPYAVNAVLVFLSGHDQPHAVRSASGSSCGAVRFVLIDAIHNRARPGMPAGRILRSLDSLWAVAFGKHSAD